MTAEYFDNTVYERALAAGESEKSARARATTKYGTEKTLDKAPTPSTNTIEPHPVELNDVDDVPYAPRIRTHSDYVWAELFLLLRWVVAAIVIIVIALLAFMPKGVAPC